MTPAAPPHTPQSADSYGRVRAGLRALAQNPRDADAWSLVLAGHFELGLAGPARELQRSARLAAPPAAVPCPQAPHAGRRSWRALQARFEANLAALHARDAAAAIRDAWLSAGARFELYQDANGAAQVLHRLPDGSWRWWPALANHAADAQQHALPPDHKDMMPGPYLLDGIELGWYFARLWRATRRTYLSYCTALFVLEPEPASLAIPMHLHDWRELLADESVMWFVGADGPERLAARLAADPDLATPRFEIRAARQRSAAPRGFAAAQAEDARRAVEVREGFADLQRRYASRDARYWAARYAAAIDGSGPPLRILASTSRHTTFLQYAMRDFQRAVEQLGHSMEVLIETDDFRRISPQTLHAAIRRLDPDLFFSIDHLRASFASRLPDRLPLVTWDQDNLPNLINDQTVRRMGPFDVVVGLPKLELIARNNLDRARFLARPMCTSPEQFDAEALSPDEWRPFECDVSFVSHASQTPQAFLAEELQAFDDERPRALLTALYPLAVERVRRDGPVDGAALHALLAAGERAGGVLVPDPALRDKLMNWHLWRLCDRVFRHDALEWAAEWARQRGRRLRIFGNGWERHPTLAPFAAGPVQNGRQLLCVYRASTINLQLMPAGFVHQRALDGLCAGAFFLTRAARGDACNPAARQLYRDLIARGVPSAADLAAADEPDLSRRFAEVARAAVIAPEQPELTFEYLRLNAEWTYAADAFPDFQDVTFCDAESFGRAADRFLADVAARRQVVERWRNVVLERFSYRAAARDFLRFLADYQQTLASRDAVGVQ